MTALIPLKSTTQEAALAELIEQVMDSQGLAILNAAPNSNTKIHEIIENYRSDLKNKTLSATINLRLEVVTNAAGDSVLQIKPEYP